MRLALLHAANPDPAIRSKATNVIRVLVAELPKGFKGLQVDCIMQTGSKLLWTDTDIVHSTAPSRIDSVVNFVRRVEVDEKASGGNFAMNVMSGQVSPCVATYATGKTAKYKPMVDGAISQVSRGKRSLAPCFRPLIFSHLGEMASDAITTIEFITTQYKHSLRNKYFEDGISSKRRTADFRTRFKDALMCANCAGFGSTLAAAGTPRAGKCFPALLRMVAFLCGRLMVLSNLYSSYM